VLGYARNAAEHAGAALLDLPTSQEALFVLAWAQRRCGQWEAARETASRAPRTGRELAAVRAIALARTDRLEEARRAFDAAAGELATLSLGRAERHLVAEAAELVGRPVPPAPGQ
jgi:hypothetical protein